MRAISIKFQNNSEKHVMPRRAVQIGHFAEAIQKLLSYYGAQIAWKVLKFVPKSNIVGTTNILRNAQTVRTCRIPLHCDEIKLL